MESLLQLFKPTSFFSFSIIEKMKKIFNTIKEPLRQKLFISV